MSAWRSDVCSSDLSRSFDAEIYKTPAWQPHRVAPSSPPEEPSMTNASPTTSTIIPCLRYRDALAAIDWLCRAFGFEQHAVYADGDPVHHAHLTFGNGLVMLGSADNATTWALPVAQTTKIARHEPHRPR